MQILPAMYNFKDAYIPKVSYISRILFFINAILNAFFLY